MKKGIVAIRDWAHYHWFWNGQFIVLAVGVPLYLFVMGGLSKHLGW